MGRREDRDAVPRDLPDRKPELSLLPLDHHLVERPDD